MKMKKKVLLSSTVTIALCLCLIAGSTFALFTDSSSFDISVTSGDVEITATAEVVATYSAEGPVAEHSDKYLKDENDNYYEHKAQETGKFLNGGTADVNDEGKLVITKITPGDKVDVKINIANSSDVALRYRYTVSVNNDNGLAAGMVLTTHSNEEYEATKSFTSEWFDVVAPGAEIPSKQFSLELPVYAGNEYQSEKVDQEDGRLAGEKSVEYTILVEAVQGNAVTTEALTNVEVYPVAGALELAIANGGYVNGGGAELPGLNAAIDMESATGGFENMTLSAENIATNPRGVVVLYSHDSTAQSNVTLGDKALINVNKANVAGLTVMLRAESITLKAGAKIDVTAANAKGIFFTDVAGDTCDLYLEESGLITVAEGAYGIYVDDSSNFTLNIHVPNAEAKAYYEAILVAPVGTGSAVNWIVAE